MPTDKIAVEPVCGWRPKHNQSHAALKWLYWKEKKLAKSSLLPRIARVGNKGERTLTHGRRKFLVDGYEEQTRTVYEFQGCFFHGCLKCFPNRTMRHPLHLNKTMYDVREETRVKGKILSPYELYHPVLPYKYDSKLLFPLCKTCAQNGTKQELLQRSKKFPHSAEKRALTGTWTTIELEKAIKKGYAIGYIYGVRYFKEQSNELFQPYIQTFMKIKQEASGWPTECDTQEKKRNYLQEYEQHESIQLDYNKVEKNPGQRSLAKLMLNSFWGKFGQHPNQTQITTCTKQSEFFQIIRDDRQVIHRIEIANEHMIEVFHSFQEVCDPVQTNVNIFVACFITSYARLKLYNALDILQKRVLYMDTDSVIYTQKPTESIIPTGNYQGEFTNELEDGDHITEFIAAGPKNYAYITKNGKQCCKVRGFTLNERGQKILHFTSIKDLVLNEILQPEDESRTLTLNNPHKIVRYPSTKTIKTMPQDSIQYKLVFDKHVIDLDSFQSYPYGYKCTSNHHI